MAIKLLITGGGSGGHLNTAFAVADHLQAKYPEIYKNLVFVGGERGMIGDSTASIEKRKVPERGLRFIGIRSGKLHRKLNFTTLKLIWGAFGGLIDSWRVLRAEKPDVVFSTGGYVTLPVVVMARILGIPSAIHEQTIAAGLANRLGARFAQKVLITFPQSHKYFPQNKIVHTGNPVQESRFTANLPASLDSEVKEFLNRAAAERSSRPFIFLTGGGLGSHKLNAWAQAHFKELASHYNFLIQTGENQVYSDYEKLLASKNSLEPNVREHICVVKWFGAEIGFIYANADLVVCRPGANTVLELLATERKAILVPIPWSSAGEQLLNAEYFIAKQSGEIVPEAELDGKLWRALQPNLAKPTLSSAKLINRNAAAQIVAELLKFSS